MNNQTQPDDPQEMRKYRMIATAMRRALQAGRSWIGPFDFPAEVSTEEADAWAKEVALQRAEEQKRLVVAALSDPYRFMMYNMPPTGKLIR